MDRCISIELLGMTSDCLPDVDYYGFWRMNDTPETAAAFAIQSAMES